MNTICLNTFVEDEGIKLPLSIASGFARFDAEVDKRFTDVFKRADRAMYKNKNNIKAATE
jgi:GGDEF domain-containing protein